jgi:hypothetical protein
MLRDNIAAGIEKIRSIDGISACAIVSRDGIIAGKYFDRDLNEQWFGALLATLLASAESAGNLLHFRDAGVVTIQAETEAIIIIGAGERFLVGVIAQGKTDTRRIASEVGAAAKELGQVI